MTVLSVVLSQMIMQIHISINTAKRMELGWRFALHSKWISHNPNTMDFLIYLMYSRQRYFVTVRSRFNQHRRETSLGVFNVTTGRNYHVRMKKRR